MATNTRRRTIQRIENTAADSAPTAIIPDTPTRSHSWKPTRNVISVLVLGLIVLGTAVWLCWSSILSRGSPTNTVEIAVFERFAKSDIADKPTLAVYSDIKDHCAFAITVDHKKSPSVIGWAKLITVRTNQGWEWTVFESFASTIDNVNSGFRAPIISNDAARRQKHHIAVELEIEKKWKAKFEEYLESLTQGGIAGRVLFTLKVDTRKVLCVAFSPDGKWLASSDVDGTVKVWDAAVGRELFTMNGLTVEG